VEGGEIILGRCTNGEKLEVFLFCGCFSPRRRGRGGGAHVDDDDGDGGDRKKKKSGGAS
jgi:hypothetical protein